MGRISAYALCAVAAAVAAVLLSAPDHSHLPVSLRPHRPLGIVALNLFGWMLRYVPSSPLLPDDASALITSGCAAAALPPGASCRLDMPGDEVGDGSTWRQGLSVLLRSAKADARLTVLGELISRGQIEQWISTRARLLHAWRDQHEHHHHHQQQQHRVERPLFITGLPRTGTTFLHNLLRQDPRLRAPLHWELVEPVGGEGSAEHAPARTARIASIQGKLDQYMGLVPRMAEVHPMSATMAEECVVTMAHSFASLLFPATADVSGYTQWLLAQQEHGQTMRWHKALLEHLQGERAREEGGGGQPPPRWVLKTPWYTGVLDDLARTYPDMTVVQTHRDPTQAVGSSASVHAKTFGAGSDDIDLRRIGRQQSAMFGELLRRTAASRARWKAQQQQQIRVVDVHLSELKRDPMAAVEALYTQLGMELTPVVRGAMEAWLARKQVRYGGHNWSLSDFGLDARAMVKDSPVFRNYCDTFELVGPGCGERVERAQPKY